MKTVTTSQFSHCPLIWMCHKRNLNNKRYKFYERALLFYDDRQSTFEELINKYKSVSIHHYQSVTINPQVVAIELFTKYNND